jgi:hypothetical protein
LAKEVNNHITNNKLKLTIGQHIPCVIITTRYFAKSGKIKSFGKIFNNNLIYEDKVYNVVSNKKTKEDMDLLNLLLGKITNIKINSLVNNKLIKLFDKVIIDKKIESNKVNISEATVVDTKWEFNKNLEIIKTDNKEKLPEIRINYIEMITIMLQHIYDKVSFINELTEYYKSPGTNDSILDHC